MNTHLIRELPEYEKPRERLLIYGVKSLSNEELLAILLRSGTKNVSVKSLAMQVLQQINGLQDLNHISINKLSNIKGIGEIKAMSIIAALELGRRIYSEANPQKVKVRGTAIIYNLFKGKFKGEVQEKLIAIYLNAKNEIIAHKVIFIGTVDASYVHPRDIYREALNLSATYVIVIHNHPSGDATPSQNDIVFTKQLVGVGEIMSIPLIDHVIFGNNSYSSYKDQKWGCAN